MSTVSILEEHIASEEIDPDVVLLRANGYPSDHQVIHAEVRAFKTRPFLDMIALEYFRLCPQLIVA